MPKILVVEDDASMAKIVLDLLQLERYQVDHASTGQQAEDYLNSFAYDLLILDRQLPGASGVEICRNYRKSANGPVLMLTAMDAVVDKVEALSAGADDYLTKPFDARELMARVKALLRRASNFNEESAQIKDITIHFSSRIVNKADKELSLTPKEFDLLEYFIKHKNQVISPDTLLKKLWHSDSDASPHAVYTCMNRLRKNLNPEDKEAIIKTVRGVGYRLDA
ncbi:MAG: response regulator transcription factor [Candidatus Obscuribacterales bacterium]|jgi:DNA-binding response OmpR family regulator|nr:response regulator transcription factor [Candidatus Obscuribacterales bacterium]